MIDTMVTYARLTKIVDGNIAQLAEDGGWASVEAMLYDLGIERDTIIGTYTILDEKLSEDASFINAMPKRSVTMMQIIHGRCYLEVQEVRSVPGSMYAWIDFYFIG